MLAPDGTVLSRNARSAVMKSPEGFPWEGDEPDSGAAMASYKQMGIYILLALYMLYRLYQWTHR
jgi:hypothetical protein